MPRPFTFDDHTDAVGERITAADVNAIQDAIETIDAAGTNYSPRLDQIPAPTAPVSLSGQLLTNLAEPVADSDAATKAYADGIATGLSVKEAVRVATTANITLSGEQVIDGVSVVAGDRVLVKDQSTASQNGIYVASLSGWSRSADANQDAEVTSGMFAFVVFGTVNAAKGFILITPDPITVGTTGLTFTQFSAAAASGITVQDEGASLATLGTTLNFTGAGVVASGTGTTKSIAIAGAASSLAPLVLLSTFANNTATADASAGIVNAINSFPDFVGGTILVDGRFRIDSTVNLPATRPVIFQGLAGTSYTSFSDTTGGAFRSQFETGTAGMTMFQFDANPSTTPNHYQRIFKNIRFVDRASIRTSTLFRLDQITRWRFEDCWFVNANKGIVLDTSFFDGLTNGDNAWAEFYNCKLHHNVVGLETVNCNGFRWYGGDILCAYVTTTDHVGMNLMDVQHVRIHGLRIDGANDSGVARGIGIDIVGKGCSITDINTEKCKIAVRVGKEQYGNETSGEEQYSKVHIINPTATGVSTIDGSTQYVFDTWARHSSLQNHKVVSAQAAYSMVRSDNWILGPLSAGDPGIKLPNLSGNPASGVAGEIVVVNGVLKIYNGSSWVSVGGQT